MIDIVLHSSKICSRFVINSVQAVCILHDGLFLAASWFPPHRACLWESSIEFWIIAVKHVLFREIIFTNEHHFMVFKARIFNDSLHTN